jgi:GNAT superfamily N-acetyltransferase
VSSRGVLRTLQALEAEFMLFNARKSLRVGEPNMRVERTGSVTQLTDTARPELSAYNRVLGFCVGELERLAQCERRFESVGAEGRYDLDGLDLCAEVTRALAALGYSERARIVYLGASSEAVEGAPRGCVDVHELAHAKLDGFFDLLAQAIGPIDADLRELRARHYATFEMPIDVAYLNGEPAGWATSFFAGPGVFLGNAFTLEAHRRRGVQTALLDARLRRARERAASLIVTDVEPETSSHRNVLRAGFEELTTRHVWSKNEAAIF